MIKRFFPAGLAIAFFFQNVVLLHAGESNFWESRRKNQQLASAAPIHPTFSNPINQPLTQLKPSARFPLPDWVQKAITPSAGINEVILSANPKAKTVILLQDIHLHVEAQNNIAETIAALSKAEPKQSRIIVGMEGADSTEVDFSRYNAYPHRLALKQTAQGMLKANLINGIELAAIGYMGEKQEGAVTLPFTVTGIEKQSEYDANINAIRQAVPLQDEAKQALTKLQLQVADLKSKNFSPELFAYSAKLDQYHQGKLSVPSFALYLNSIVPASESNIRKLIDASLLEGTIDFKRADLERGRVIEKLATKMSKPEIQQLLQMSLSFKAGNISYHDYYEQLKSMARRHAINLTQYPEFSLYIQYVLKTEALKSHLVFSELKTLQAKVEESLSKTTGQRQALRQQSHYYLLQKLISHTLTESEWYAYQAQRGEIAGIPALSVFEDFYRLAIDRNDTMAGKMAERLNAGETSYGVLVAGGFHSTGIAQLLKQKGLTVVIATPKVTKIEEGALSSVDILASGRLPLDQIFVGERLLTPLPAATATPGQAQRLTQVARAAAEAHRTGQPASDGPVKAAPATEEGKDVGTVLEIPNTDGSDNPIRIIADDASPRSPAAVWPFLIRGQNSDMIKGASVESAFMVSMVMSITMLGLLLPIFFPAESAYWAGKVLSEEYVKHWITNPVTASYTIFAAAVVVVNILWWAPHWYRVLKKEGKVAPDSKDLAKLLSGSLLFNILPMIPLGLNLLLVGTVLRDSYLGLMLTFFLIFCIGLFWKLAGFGDIHSRDPIKDEASDWEFIAMLILGSALFTIVSMIPHVGLVLVGLLAAYQAPHVRNLSRELHFRWSYDNFNNGGAAATWPFLLASDSFTLPVRKAVAQAGQVSELLQLGQMVLGLAFAAGLLLWASIPIWLTELKRVVSADMLADHLMAMTPQQMADLENALEEHRSFHDGPLSTVRSDASQHSYTQSLLAGRALFSLTMLRVRKVNNPDNPFTREEALATARLVAPYVTGKTLPLRWNFRTGKPMIKALFLAPIGILGFTAELTFAQSGKEILAQSMRASEGSNLLNGLIVLAAVVAVVISAILVIRHTGEKAVPEPEQKNEPPLELEYLTDFLSDMRGHEVKDLMARLKTIPGTAASQEELRILWMVKIASQRMKRTDVIKIAELCLPFLKRSDLPARSPRNPWIFMAQTEAEFLKAIKIGLTANPVDIVLSTLQGMKKDLEANGPRANVAEIMRNPWVTERLIQSDILESPYEAEISDLYQEVYFTHLLGHRINQPPAPSKEVLEAARRLSAIGEGLVLIDDEVVDYFVNLLEHDPLHITPTTDIRALVKRRLEWFQDIYKEYEASRIKQKIPLQFTYTNLWSIYLPHAEWTIQRREENSRHENKELKDFTYVQFIHSAQGGGKTTLAKFMPIVLGSKTLNGGRGYRSVAYGYDDYYLDYDGLVNLKHQHEGYVQGRGPYDTHGIEEVAATTRAFRETKDGTPIAVNLFDKALNAGVGGRPDSSTFPTFETPVDFVFIDNWQGWGNPIQESELEKPIDIQEEYEDYKYPGFRQHLNKQAQKYRDLMKPLIHDVVAMIDEDLDVQVSPRREIQEMKIREIARKEGRRVKSTPAIVRFVTYFIARNRRVDPIIEAEAARVYKVGRNYKFKSVRVQNQDSMIAAAYYDNNPVQILLNLMHKHDLVGLIAEIKALREKGASSFEIDLVVEQLERVREAFQTDLKMTIESAATHILPFFSALQLSELFFKHAHLNAAWPTGNEHLKDSLGQFAAEFGIQIRLEIYANEMSNSRPGVPVPDRLIYVERDPQNTDGYVIRTTHVALQQVRHEGALLRERLKNLFGVHLSAAEAEKLALDRLWGKEILRTARVSHRQAVQAGIGPEDTGNTYDLTEAYSGQSAEEILEHQPLSHAAMVDTVKITAGRSSSGAREREINALKNLMKARPILEDYIPHPETRTVVNHVGHALELHGTELNIQGSRGVESLHSFPVNEDPTAVITQNSNLSWKEKTGIYTEAEVGKETTLTAFYQEHSVLDFVDVAINSRGTGGQLYTLGWMDSRANFEAQLDRMIDMLEAQKMDKLKERALAVKGDLASGKLQLLSIESDRELPKFTADGSLDISQTLESLTAQYRAVTRREPSRVVAISDSKKLVSPLLDATILYNFCMIQSLGDQILQVILASKQA